MSRTLTIPEINARLVHKGVVCLRYEKEILPPGSDREAKYYVFLRCERGHEYRSQLNNVLSSAKNGCRECACNKPLTIEVVNKRIAKHGFTCVSLDPGTYSNKSVFTCREGHTFESDVHNAIRRGTCSVCSGRRRITIQIVNERLASRGLSCIEYANSVNKKSTFVCQHNHRFEATAGNVMAQTGCPACYAIRRNRIPKEVTK